MGKSAPFRLSVCVALLGLLGPGTAQGADQLITCGTARDGYTIRVDSRGMTLQTHGRFWDYGTWRSEKSGRLPLARNVDEDQGDWVGFTATDDWNYYRIHLPRAVLGKASASFTSSLAIKGGNQYQCRSRIR